MDYEFDFLKALLQSIFLETLILIVFFNLPFFSKTKTPVSTILLAGLVSTILTLPYVWFIIPMFVTNKTVFIFTSEIIVIIVESLIYIKFFKHKYSVLLLASVLGNMFSFLVGYYII